MRNSRLRAGALVAAAALIVPLGLPAVASAQPGGSDTLKIAVNGFTPSTPVPSTTPHPIAFTLTITNTTSTTFDAVRIDGERGDPIGNQRVLDKSLAHPTPPASPGPQIPSHPRVTVKVPANSSRTVIFRTTTSTIDDGKGICLCYPSVYPLFFSAHENGPGGVDQLLGVTATYLPSFYARPASVRVSWVWPLIDQPHRLTDTTVFTDDLLTSQVAGPDGRLYRALQVVRQVGASIPLTLVIDPELLDELEVMAKGRYTVLQPGGRTVPGTGQQPATAWLDQLRALLTNDPNVQVELTPYADPDVESLSRHGLRWQQQLPDSMIANVSAALANRPPDSSIAWPAAGALDRRTLNRLAAAGVGTVVVNDSAITPPTDSTAVPAGLARLQADHRNVAAALTTKAIETDASDVLTLGGPGASSLPDLMAELAVRAAQEPDVEHPVVITAPRYVDPSVTASVQAIRETSRSTFAQPISLQSAVSGDLLPNKQSRLAKVPRSATTLLPAAIAAAHLTESMTPAIASLLDRRTDPTARAFVASLPFAVQRAESSAWRQGNAVKAGRAFAKAVTAKVDGITDGVKIVAPRGSRSYTLTSSTSPLPITVENDLTYPVKVRVAVNTVNGLPGLTTRDIGVQTIEARGKAVLHLPTSISRSGRIQIDAQLLTPNGVPLGNGVLLTVHTTVLGVVGVVITVVAGVVLALALLVRLLRRFGSRNGRKPAAEPASPAPPLSEVQT